MLANQVNLATTIIDLANDVEFCRTCKTPKARCICEPTTPTTVTTVTKPRVPTTATTLTTPPDARQAAYANLEAVILKLAVSKDLARNRARQPEFRTLVAQALEAYREYMRTN